MSEGNKSKTTGFVISPWKSVDVSLPNPSSDKNHYDNVSFSRGANKDLEGQPSESVGMFLGLEVLDGSLYEVRDRKMIIKSAQKESPGNRETKHEKQIKHHENEKGNSRGQKRTSSELSVQDNLKPPKKKKKKKKKNKSGDNSTPECSTSNPPTDKDITNSESKNEKNNSIDIQMGEQQQQQPHKKKNKKKKKKSGKNRSSDCSTSNAPTDKDISRPHQNSVNADQILTIQSSWLASTNGVSLHMSLCEKLAQRGFERPTPIQAATLPAAIMGRRNIVGAAVTGSGKTLAYVLPIFQYLFDEECDEKKSVLEALILAPTRELAIQVSHECEKLMPKSTGVLVGGLAAQKQIRVLETRKPPIIIGTPGRLWEMMSCHEHDHLNNLSNLRFLVIDEADRMVQQGSFPQLKNILNAVHTANPLGDDDEEDSEEDDDRSETSNEEYDRLLSLPGVPGEARVLMLDDILAAQTKNNKAITTTKKISDEIYESENENSDTALVHRQTFIFSATLTLDPSKTYVKKIRKSKNFDLPSGAIGEILSKAHVYGKTKVVDLTSSKKSDIGMNEHSPKNIKRSKLPPGLKLHMIECTQKHKDSYLYAYLVTTTQGASGPSLIFCNSIASVKRVGSMLKMLQLPVKMLHAKMSQKARLTALETLQSGKERAIVVCTDVAARGLDIPNITTIVHYDVARIVGTFIHRAGRTARGMGEGAVGTSMSLVAPAEDKQQKAIIEEVGKESFSPANLDGRLLTEAQQRVNLAEKVVSCDDIESKAKRNNTWFYEAAKEAGLEVDDNMLEEGLAGGDRRDRQKLREANKARDQLQILLSRPMIKQRFGKFITPNSATISNHMSSS